MRIVVTSTMDALERDFRRAPAATARKVATAVKRNAQQGNRAAARFARQTAGEHGKHYHKAFSAESVGGDPMDWEYGPDAAMPQGGMSFNDGSRNQPAHNDLENSMDVQVPKLLKDLRDAIKDPLG